MILHVDMDAFYASVEQRDHPAFRGRPVIVGGSHGRGVVTAASYEARRFGVHSAMPGRRAMQLCPDAVFVRSRIDHYAAVGHQVREIFYRFTPVVQPLSLDEAFLDVAGVRRLHGDAATIGRAIKTAIRDELDLPASVGIGPIKFVAKIASDLEKPDGFVEVPDDAAAVRAFLDPLPVSRLWGVGRVGGEKLHRLGYRTIADLRRTELKAIDQTLGSWGRHLWKLANGIDARAVVPDRRAKGIGHERTFETDLTEIEAMRSVISYLAEQVGFRLRRARRLASVVSIKYRREDFRTFNRSKKLSAPTDSTRQIFETAGELLRQMRERQPRGVRLLGVRLSSLSAAGAPMQMSLFGAETQNASEAADRLTDAVTDRMGKHQIYRASSHGWVRRDR